jgi:hypothetical protein
MGVLRFIFLGSIVVEVILNSRKGYLSIAVALKFNTLKQYGERHIIFNTEAFLRAFEATVFLYIIRSLKRRIDLHLSILVQNGGDVLLIDSRLLGPFNDVKSNDLGFLLLNGFLILV